ncbi:MAG: carbohydrate-binding domain-containing protein [Oscillospiraceae bacterium]|nr:carbohydrate-binding domain-containing protein [Oscillospiraceae bacterium]
MKKILSLTLVALICLSLLAGCGSMTIGGSKNEASSSASSSTAASGSEAAGAETSAIVLNGDSVSTKVGGVSVSGTTVKIGAGGTYTLTGTLNNGMVIVNTGEDAQDVTLILDNADITCLSDSAIRVDQAKNCYIQLANGSTNRVTSGVETDMANYNAATATGAAIYSEDDLEISGNGVLEINGYRNNGITGKDDVEINGGTITVTAANNGIRGSESVDINEGVVTVTSRKDGIKSTSSKKEDKGYVTIDGGVVTVTSGGDGISAETVLTINGGELNVIASGDPAAASSKGLKAKTDLVINGGDVIITAIDHAVHSAAGITINAGSLALTSESSKGIAAHEDITVNGGEISIVCGKDGIETKKDIYLNGGSVTIDAAGVGIKAGEKGTGFGEKIGSVIIDGGEVLVAAGENMVKFQRLFEIVSGSILAVGTSEKLPVVSDNSCAGFVSKFVCPADSEVKVDGTELSLPAPRGGSTLLCYSSSMSSGTEYHVSSGSTGASFTAK